MSVAHDQSEGEAGEHPEDGGPRGSGAGHAFRRRAIMRAVVLVVVVTVAASAVFDVVGLPSPVLFGSLLGGMVQALSGGPELRLPPLLFRTGQALIGVTIGAMVSVEALRQMGTDLPTITAVTLGTLAISIASGRLLALRRDVDPVTGAFSLIAGGASGVVAISRDLGADDRVVTVVQYLRVLLVLVTMPVVTTVVFRPDRGVGSLTGQDTHLLTDLVFVVVAVVLGQAVARLVPVPTAALLGPLAVAVALAASGWLGDVAVPGLLQDASYAVIGAQVGLRFTRDSLRSIARMLPVVVALIVALIAACAGLGALLAALTPVDGLTAYLATTPGGLFAVLATAADSGSDVTYVMGLQVFRLLVILLVTPVLARWLRRRSGPGRALTSG